MFAPLGPLRSAAKWSGSLNNVSLWCLAYSSEKLTVISQHLRRNFKDRSLGPERRRCNIDINGQTTTLSCTDRLEDTFPSLNASGKLKSIARLVKAPLDGEEVVGGGLPHEMIEKSDSRNHIVVNLVLAANKSLHDLKRNSARLTNEDAMLVLALSRAARTSLFF